MQEKMTKSERVFSGICRRRIVRGCKKTNMQRPGLAEGRRGQLRSTASLPSFRGKLGRQRPTVYSLRGGPCSCRAENSFNPQNMHGEFAAFCNLAVHCFLLVVFPDPEPLPPRRDDRIYPRLSRRCDPAGMWKRCRPTAGASSQSGSLKKTLCFSRLFSKINN